MFSQVFVHREGDWLPSMHHRSHDQGVCLRRGICLGEGRGFGIPPSPKSAYRGEGIGQIPPPQDAWDATGYSQQRSAGVTPEVNLGECTSRTPPPSANKAAHSGLKSRYVTKIPKTGVSMSYPQFFFFWILKKSLDLDIFYLRSWAYSLRTM